MMTGKLLGVLIALVLVLIHDALAVTEVGNPEILPECSHLTIKGDQINSFLGSHGAPCCMCGKGTYKAKECSVHNPNSTQCDPCKYDPVKEQWTYLDFEPHMEEECSAQPSCISFLVSVGGSSSSQARCVCPDGTDPVDGFICPPISNVSSKTDTVSPKNVEDDDKVFQSPTPGSPTYASTEPRQLAQKAFEPVEAVLISNSETTKGPISVSPHLDSSTASSNQSTGNHTTAGVKAERSNNTAFFFIIGALVIIIILVILYFVGEKYGLFGSGGICCTKHERSENDVTYTRGKPSDETDKSCDQLLGKGQQEVKIEMTPIEEMPQSNNMAVPLLARWHRLVQRFGIRLPQTHPTDDRLGEPDAAPDRDPIDPEVGADGRDRVERPVNCRHPISEREKQLRDDAFSEMAEQIDPTDLCRIGRALLSTKRNAFEDIYGSCPCPPDREEKARKIFIRAVQLNPQLSLQDILNLVRGLGYLRAIVKAKMDQMRTDGEVD